MMERTVKMGKSWKLWVPMLVGVLLILAGLTVPGCESVQQAQEGFNQASEQVNAIGQNTPGGRALNELTNGGVDAVASILGGIALLFGLFERKKRKDTENAIDDAISSPNNNVDPNNVADSKSRRIIKNIVKRAK